MFGAFNVVTTGGLPQPVVQSGSPPPVTVAVLVTLEPAATVGVTLIVMTTDSVICRSACAIVQVTTWPVNPQPGPAELIVRPVGTVSVTVASAVASALPLFVTVSV